MRAVTFSIISCEKLCSLPILLYYMYLHYSEGQSGSNVNFQQQVSFTLLYSPLSHIILIVNSGTSFQGGIFEIYLFLIARKRLLTVIN